MQQTLPCVGKIFEEFGGGEKRCTMLTNLIEVNLYIRIDLASKLEINFFNQYEKLRIDPFFNAVLVAEMS